MTKKWIDNNFNIFKKKNFTTNIKNKSMKIIVTGGCGYTGTVLTQELIKLGHHVIVIDTQWFGNHLKKVID